MFLIYAQGMVVEDGVLKPGKGREQLVRYFSLNFTLKMHIRQEREAEKIAW